MENHRAVVELQADITRYEMTAGYPSQVHAADSHDLIRVHAARENNLKSTQEVSKHYG